MENDSRSKEGIFRCGSKGFNFKLLSHVEGITANGGCATGFEIFYFRICFRVYCHCERTPTLPKDYHIIVHVSTFMEIAQFVSKLLNPF